MLGCPKCEKELKPRFNEYPIEPNDYIEIFLDCEDEHQYFVRITKEELIEDYVRLIKHKEG